MFGNNTKNGVENAGNDVKDTAKDTTDNNTRDMVGRTNSGYNTRMTSAVTNVVTSNTMMWILLALIAVAIIALIWYYVAQPKNRNRNDL